MRLARALAVLLVTVAAASAAEPVPIAVTVPARNEPVSYAKEVADILDAKCVGCHSSALAESSSNLEDVAGMLKGGKRGPAIVPGKADESLLFQMAAHRVEPVDAPARTRRRPAPLTPEELGLLKLWIDAGAKDDSDEEAEPARPIELGDPAPGRPADRRGRPDGRRRPRRRRPGQRRPGLRRRLGPRDRLARRPQGHHPVAPLQPRRQAARGRQLPDRHALERPDRRPGQDLHRPRRPGQGAGRLRRRPDVPLGGPRQDDPGLGPRRGQADPAVGDRPRAGAGAGPVARRQDARRRGSGQRRPPARRRRRQGAART